ncbi:MAG: hypothetical protein ACRD10_00850, partial [Terriglobia bacterium]
MKKLLWIIPVAAVLCAGAWLAKELYSQYRGYPSQVIVNIQPGASAPSVAELLVRDGVVANRLPVLFRYWMGRGRGKTIKFGEYLFDRPLT